MYFLPYRQQEKQLDSFRDLFSQMKKPAEKEN